MSEFITCPKEGPPWATFPPRNNHSGNEMQKKQIRIAMANRMMMFTIVGMVLLLMGMLLVAVMFLMLLQDGGGGGGGGDGGLHEGH